MEPCSPWGRNVISEPISRAAYYYVGRAFHVYLQQSNDYETRLLAA